MNKKKIWFQLRRISLIPTRRKPFVHGHNRWRIVGLCLWSRNQNALFVVDDPNNFEWTETMWRNLCVYFDYTFYIISMLQPIKLGVLSRRSPDGAHRKWIALHTSCELQLNHDNAPGQFNAACVNVFASRISPLISLLWEFTFSKFKSLLKGSKFQYVEEIQENLTGQLLAILKRWLPGMLATM